MRVPRVESTHWLKDKREPIPPKFEVFADYYRLNVLFLGCSNDILGRSSETASSNGVGSSSRYITNDSGDLSMSTPDLSMNTLDERSSSSNLGFNMPDFSKLSTNDANKEIVRIEWKQPVYLHLLSNHENKHFPR